MSLLTGKVIHRHQWTTLPAGRDILLRVRRIAEEQKQGVIGQNFKFESSVGNELTFDDNHNLEEANMNDALPSDNREAPQSTGESYIHNETVLTDELDTEDTRNDDKVEVQLEQALEANVMEPRSADELKHQGADADIVESDTENMVKSRSDTPSDKIVEAKEVYSGECWRQDMDRVPDKIVSSYDACELTTILDENTDTDLVLSSVLFDGYDMMKKVACEENEVNIHDGDKELQDDMDMEIDMNADVIENANPQVLDEEMEDATEDDENVKYTKGDTVMSPQMSNEEFPRKRIPEVPTSRILRKRAKINYKMLNNIGKIETQLS